LNNLYFKVLTSVGFVLFLVLSGTIYFYIQTQKEVVIDQINKTANANLSSFQNELISFKKKLILASEIISKDKAVSKSLDLQSSRGINRKLNDLSIIFPFYHYILLTETNFEVFASSTKDENGNIYLGEELLGLNIQKHPMYKHNSEDSTYMSSVAIDPFLEKIEKKAMLAQWQISPIVSYGKHIGWLVCSFNWQREISKFIKTSKKHLIYDGIPVLDLTINETSVKNKVQNDNELVRSKIISFGDLKYSITITFDKTILLKPIDELLNKTIIIFVISYFILLTIIYLTLNKFLLSRIETLTNATREFKKGNLDFRMENIQDDELGVLGLTMNSMAQDIQNKLSEIEEARDSLEIKIKDRTKKIESSRIELERSNQELDEFAFIASHDLKAPLRNIENYSNFLIEDYSDSLDDDGIEYLNSISRLTAKMSELLSNLLYYSRVGRSKYAIKKTNLNDVIDEIKDSISTLIKEQNISIIIENPLPIIHCDKTRITEVYRNLIMNSIKYNNSDHKIIELGVKKSTEKEQSFLNGVNLDVYYVKDNGIGIHEKHIDLVFKIFKRLNNKEKYGEGTGAGLTIIKKILKRHNGEIWAKSKFGEGATFNFTIGNTVNNDEQ